VGKSKHNKTLLRCKESKDRQHVSALSSIRPSSGLMALYKKGPKHVVYLLTPYILTKFCCVLTYPPYINCDIEDIWLGPCVETL